ncbi:MAG: DUF4465 domain-containing protein [Bacteroidota bacterium]
MRSIFTMIFVALSLSLMGQSVADFENLNVEPDSFLNGSDLSGGFDAGDVFLPNEFNAQFSSWSGWAISNTTDTLTPGPDNQYSSVVGTGVDGSETYAVTHRFGGPTQMKLKNAAMGKPVQSIFVTNATYAYRSMLDGDMFAKQFGGVTGDDPDFFLLTIKGYYNGSLIADTIDFYLADYRFSNNSEDYIVNEWTKLDLSPLGNVDSLFFFLSSSDVGMFGMNTPAYFCVDNVETTSFATSLEDQSAALSVYPNPSYGQIQLKGNLASNMTVSLVNLQGSVLRRWNAVRPMQPLDLADLPKGIYQLSIQQGEERTWQRIVLK